MKHTKHILQTIVLAVALIAAGQTAMAETTTYTVTGGNGGSNYEFYAQFTDGSTTSNRVNWTYNSTAEISFNLRTNLTLTLSDTAKQLSVRDNAIGGRGATTLTVSGNNSYYIYRVRLLTADGNVIQLNSNGEAVTQGGVSECDYWNMTKSFSQTYTNGILFSKIEVSYATAIPITDAVLSGVDNSYIVSNTAIAPVPTVTWHGTTLTNNTHYTLSYQNNSSAGTATVTATGNGKFSSSTNVSANYTLNWATYTVRFNKNSDGASGTMADQAFTYGTAQNLTANAFTAPTGYSFAGWSTTANGAVAYTDGQSVNNLTATNGATVDLYAQWTPITYNITYDLAGGSVATANPATYTIETATFTLVNPTRKGYAFDGWTGSNGNTPETTVTIPQGSMDDRSYIANWTANTYTVRFNKNSDDASGTMSDQAFTYGTAQNLTANAFTAPTGYSFAGWSTTANGAVAYTDGQSVNNLTATNGATVDLYAQWTPITYNITYDLAGGSVATANPATYTIETATFTLVNPTRKGYAFDGWTGSNGNTPETTVTIPQGSMDDRSYIANWTANTYTVRFNKNSDDASGTMSDQAFTYGTAQNLTANAFTAPTGHLFAGWNTKADGKGAGYSNQQSVSNLTAENGATVDLFAQWGIPSGTCGRSNVNNGMDVTWALTDTDNDGTYETITISGTGDMANYPGGTSQPWNAYKSDITIVVIEECVTSIGEYAFKGHTALTSVSIASSVATIGNSAFNGCTSLTTINGASGVTDAGAKSIFADTYWLNNRPDGLTYVGHVAYKFKGDATSVNLDAGTTQIADKCFLSSQITSIDIPTTVTSIGANAFACSALTSVIIPASVKIIGNNAFEASSLQIIYVLRSGSSSSEITRAGNDTFAHCSDLTIVVPADAYGYYKGLWNSYSNELTRGYTVTCDEGITATSYAPIVAEDETVTLSGTGTILDGYAFAGYCVKDADNNDVTVTETSGVYSFFMPAGNVTVSAQWTPDQSVKYIDGDGVEQTCSDFTSIQSSSGGQTLGDSNNDEAWYVVTGNVTIGGTLTFEDQSAHLILCDGANLIVTSDNSLGIAADGYNVFFTIYGQSSGTGAVSATGNEAGISSMTFTINGGKVTATGQSYGIDAVNVTINGGIVSAIGDHGISAMSGVTINGGSINATTGSYGITSDGVICVKGGIVTAAGSKNGIRAYPGSVQIIGGNVTATGGEYGIHAESSISMNWTNISDRITASSYNKNPQILSSRSFIDNEGNIYSGPINADNLAGKTLRPYLSPSAGTDITLVQGTKDGVTAWWGTFCNSTSNFVLSEGAAAYTMGSDYKLYRLGVDGRTIPKNTAVVIIASEATIQTYSIGSSNNLLVPDHAPGGNILRGSNNPVPVADITTGTPHVLGTASGIFGFHPFVPTDTNTSIPAHKAYYVE